MGSGELILVEVKDGVGSITFNRPEALNALTPEMTQELVDITYGLERNADVRCVVLRGNGSAFTSGTDVAQMYTWLTEARDEHLAQIEQKVIRSHQFIYHLRRMNKPVVAAVHGAIAGLGCGILMAADLVVARSDAYFLIAYRHVGLTVDCNISYFLPRMIGERRALQLAMLGEKVDSARALELGLFNWVVDEDEFEAKVNEVVRRLVNGPTLALAGIKTLYRNSLEMSFDQQSHREAESIAQVAGTHDHLEGVKAFVEKRKPVFRGA